MRATSRCPACSKILHAGEATECPVCTDAPPPVPGAVLYAVGIIALFAILVAVAAIAQATLDLET